MAPLVLTHSHIPSRPAPNFNFQLPPSTPAPAWGLVTPSDPEPNQIGGMEQGPGVLVGNPFERRTFSGSIHLLGPSGRFACISAGLPFTRFAARPRAECHSLAQFAVHLGTESTFAPLCQVRLKKMPLFLTGRCSTVRIRQPHCYPLHRLLPLPLPSTTASLEWCSWGKKKREDHAQQFCFSAIGSSDRQVGTGQNETTRGPQVFLVLGSIHQGKPFWGTYF